MKERLAQILFKTGFLRVVQRSHSQFLTVLNYHRIGDPIEKGFNTFRPNISTTSQGFKEQMKLISQWFNVVSLKNVVNWLNGEDALPSRPALITFDDGYVDNYLLAAPILKKYKFPALIFLTTSYIDSDRPFYWDLIAYCFYHTQRDRVSLPGMDDHHWENPGQLDKVIHTFTERVKSYSEDEKQKILSHLPDQLGVSIPAGTFRNLIMSWDQVRTLMLMDIEFGGHTMTHPILTRISIEKARNEIIGSKAIIEAETREVALSFAYPNGQFGDFNPFIAQLVSQAGYKIAFTLINGPKSFKAVRQKPFEINRIFISHKDTLTRFAVKVCGIKRFGIFG
jgi:peptidoglycan/xylan/chitin deacetylase (PgdA/CDA1 family)